MNTPNQQQHQFVDPVCGMSVDPDTATAKTVHDGVEIYFCAQGCKKAFDAHPEKYMSQNQRASGGAISTASTRPPVENHRRAAIERHHASK